MLTHGVDGAEIERRRRAIGLSRERLGAAAGGIASATVVRIERGLVKSHPSTIAALLAALEGAERQQGQGSKEVEAGADATAIQG